MDQQYVAENALPRPDFAAWLSLMVDPDDWTKDFIVSAAQGYFKESPPSESLLPELETVVP